jgi:hypothetical protein
MREGNVIAFGNQEKSSNSTTTLGKVEDEQRGKQ